MVVQLGLVLLNHEKNKERWNMPPPMMGELDVWIVGLSLLVVIDTAFVRRKARLT